jgi:lipopolysaccharide transport system ATP-binding protein
MAQPLVIRAEGVGKRYRLGQTSGTSLGEELHAWGARLMGRPAPLNLLDASRDQRTTGRDFRALHDVSFQLHKGEVLGIIGRNGAGKSTLLKLLSRITLPSAGSIRMRGRVSSLLEVGTGFNPELTGRENIFLNGAILGMRKAEIQAKQQEIIAFSGIEHHIDSPVKRYSSGMKVRLGFAVAAHLEPDILIIDEVLAVGDAEFQRKCLGKMKDAAQSERTILFVSHNMTAVRSLCSRVLWLHDGMVRMDGPTDQVVNAYLGTYTDLSSERRWAEQEAPGNELVRVVCVKLERSEPAVPLTWSDPFAVGITFTSSGVDDADLNFTVWFYNSEDILVLSTGWREKGPGTAAIPPGERKLRVHVPGKLLNTGQYRLVIHCFRAGKVMFMIESSIAFEIHEAKREGSWFGQRKGVVRPLLDWEECST